MREWKMRLGAPYTVLWQAPRRVSGVPTLTVRLSAVDASLSDVVLALSSLRGNTSAKVCADDPTVIELLSAVTAPEIVGVTGGQAFLVSSLAPESRGQVVPIQPAHINGRHLHLKTILPAWDEWVSKTPSIDWNLWTATLTVAAHGDLLNTARRSIPATIGYTRDTDGGPTMTGTHDFVVHVVRRPFETGVTDGHLFELIEAFGFMVPESQQGFGPQILSAKAFLVERLRAKGLDEDRANGGDFAEIHKRLAVAEVLQAHASIGADRFEAANFYRSQGESLLKDRLRDLSWYDSDGDGQVDAGETGKAFSGARSGVSSRGGVPASKRKFRLGMSH